VSPRDRSGVGPAGLAVGIDISSDQIRAAEAHCEDLANVEARVGDLLAVDYPDGHFDATVSVQVLEYVADVDAALAARPGNETGRPVRARRDELGLAVLVGWGR
jgi:SAM-dependent methyltransferase